MEEIRTGDEQDDAGPPPRPFTLASLALAVGVFGAGSVRRPVLLGGGSAFAGVALAIVGLITISTCEGN